MLVERIQRADACLRKIPYVTGDHGEAMDQCRGGDQLVERALGMKHPKVAPQFDGPPVDGKDVACMAALHRQQPFVEQPALRAVPAEALQFHAATQFPHRDDREKQGMSFGLRFFKEGAYAGVCPVVLALLADDVGIDEIYTWPRGY